MVDLYKRVVLEMLPKMRRMCIGCQGNARLWVQSGSFPGSPRVPWSGAVFKAAGMFFFFLFIYHLLHLLWFLSWRFQQLGTRGGERETGGWVGTELVNVHMQDPSLGNL